jgi:hypothetical protein
MTRSASILLAIAIGLALAGCGDDDGGETIGDGTQVAPLELTAQLCDDPANLQVLLDSTDGSNPLSTGDVNEEQLQRMIDAPTEGPFFMFNLIKYRERAQYADGRETDLTGREADALYSPFDFLQAIDARLAFVADVDTQIDGDETVWDTVAVVEYPCPLAFMAMVAHPEFQARAVHKDAGVEKTIVMVTRLSPPLLPPGTELPSPFPATEDDPAFELIHVQDFHDIAQYEEGANEPTRTGKEAWEQYVANSASSGGGLGVFPSAQLVVQGVLIGDDRTWDEINIIHMPSMAGFQALLANETRQEGRYHRLAALAHNYSLITYPGLNDFRYSEITISSNQDITQTGPLSGNPVHELFDPEGTVWLTFDLTPEEYDALELPEGWNRNQSRGGVASDDSPGPQGRFLRSPGREVGVFTHREMFGALWQHMTNIVGFQGFLDDQNLLIASTVQKDHELTWRAGSNITVLTSPAGEHYALISRDARRTSDTPTIPDGWLLRTFRLEEDLPIRLPFDTTVVRTDNQDSFQGPLPAAIDF